MKKKAKKKKNYTFLLLLGLGALGSLGLGARECVLRYQRNGDAGQVKTYLEAHAGEPFWADLMPDRFLTGDEMQAAEALTAEEENTAGFPETAEVTIPEETGGSTATETSEESPNTESAATVTGEDASAGNPGEETVTDTDPEKEETPEEETTGIYFDETYNLWMARDAVYRTYEPTETKSAYYKDRGLTPLTPDYGFTEVEDDYFADAAFVGDSRMLGLHDYSGWSESADFYCENGFSVYRWTKGAKTTFQSRERKGKGTDVDLKEAFSSKTYGKVYLLAGMNDLGYGNTELFQGWMQQLIDMVRETQPDATIYLLGNLHISKSQDGVQPAMDNINTNDKNLALSGLADGETVFYLDANDLFCDEEGYLRDDITFDGYHLYAANYVEWADYIRSHAVVR
jgi:hypothetical protein